MERGSFQFDIMCVGYAAAHLAVFEKFLVWFLWGNEAAFMPQRSLRTGIEQVCLKTFGNEIFSYCKWGFSILNRLIDKGGMAVALARHELA